MPRLKEVSDSGKIYYAISNYQAKKDELEGGDITKFMEDDLLTEDQNTLKNQKNFLKEPKKKDYKKEEDYYEVLYNYENNMPEEQYRINVNQKYRGFLKEPNWDTMRNDIGYFDGTGAQLLFEKAARKSFYIPIHMTKGYFHSYINKKRLSMPSDDHGHYMHLREDGETVDFRVRKEGVSTEEFFDTAKESWKSFRQIMKSIVL